LGAGGNGPTGKCAVNYCPKCGAQGFSKRSKRGKESGKGKQRLKYSGNNFHFPGQKGGPRDQKGKKKKKRGHTEVWGGGSSAKKKKPARVCVGEGERKENG